MFWLQSYRDSLSPWRRRPCQSVHQKLHFSCCFLYIIPYLKTSPPLQINSLCWMIPNLYFMNFMNECFQENHTNIVTMNVRITSSFRRPNRPSKFHYVPPSKPQWRTSSELQNWTPNTGRSGETRIPIINVKNKHILTILEPF